jgi:cell division transport system permease protein
VAEPLARHTAARGVGARLRGLGERHVQTFVASLGRLARAPFGTALTIGVIGIALALPACLGLVVVNARSLAGGWQDALDLTLYLKPSLPNHDAEQLREHIAVRADVASARLVSAAQGLDEFRRWSGLGAALDALKDNPLPAAIVVQPRFGEPRDAATIERLADALRAQPGVDQVQLDTAWVRRFTAILDGLERAATLLAAALAVAVLLVVGNTIRLDIDTRRAEIEVTKLVGGSDGFVRRPFLYSGVWYGLGGGLLAVALLGSLVLGLTGPVAHIAGAYGSPFALRGPGAGAAFALVGGGALLGWLGAFVSATRHLRAIEPGIDS